MEVLVGLRDRTDVFENHVSGERDIELAPHARRPESSQNLPLHPCHGMTNFFFLIFSLGEGYTSPKH